MKRLAIALLLLSMPVRAQILDSEGVDVLQTRISEMEQVIARQTDTIERLSHRIDQMERRMGQINDDIEVRFDELRKTPAPAAVPAPSSSPFAAAEASDIPENTSAKELYDTGRELIKTGKYLEAARNFEAFLKRYPDDGLAANARYWLGESHYARGDFQNAAVVFAEGFQKHPKGQKAADNLLKLGLSMQALKKTKEACTAFTELQKEFPKAPDSILNKAKAESRKLQCK